MNSVRHLLRPTCVALLAGLNACGGNSETQQAALDTSLIQALSKVEGQYAWSDEQQRYLFSEKEELEEIIKSRNTDSVVQTLVSCLDNLSNSQSSLEGKAVVVGVICYEALSQVAYYESTTPEGDVAADWPGHVSPTATPDQLQAAKEAWTEVVRTRSYILL